MSEPRKLQVIKESMVKVDGVDALRFRIEPGHPKHMIASVDPPLVALMAAVPRGTEVLLSVESIPSAIPTGMKIVSFVLAEPAAE